MSLNFPHASLLGLTQESRFFEAGFNYSNSKRLSIQGNLVDLAGVYGITGIWDSPEGLLATIAGNNNFQPLVINGVNFGSGRIQNLSFSHGIDVKTKSYSVDLVVFDSGDLFNLTGTFYSTINTSGWQYLQDFREDYSFDQKQNGGYSYRHNAAIRFNSGVGGLDAITAAKALAKSLFTGSNLGTAFYSGYTNKLGKRFYNESYDLIDNSCQFGEAFDFDSDSGTYSVTRTNQFELNEQGIITVGETAQIQGIVDPTYQNALAVLGPEMSGAYSRCNTVFSLYAPANPYPLLSPPTVSSRSLDIFNNNIGYNIAFTNQISNLGSYYWDYTQQVDYAEEISRVTERGRLVGRAQNHKIAYEAAAEGFKDIQQGLNGRTSLADRTDAFYTTWVHSPTVHFLETQQQGHSPVRGTIEYGFTFSNEQVVVGTNGVKRLESTNQTQEPVYKYGRFAIFNNKEILQNELTNTVGVQSISVKMLGEKYVPLSAYINDGVNYINNLPKPSNENIFLSDVSYIFNPYSNTAGTNVSYTFNTIPANQSINIQ